MQLTSNFEESKRTTGFNQRSGEVKASPFCEDRNGIKEAAKSERGKELNIKPGCGFLSLSLYKYKFPEHLVNIQNLNGNHEVLITVPLLLVFLLLQTQKGKTKGEESKR